jgi:hypothetical protein
VFEIEKANAIDIYNAAMRGDTDMLVAMSNQLSYNNAYPIVVELRRLLINRKQFFLLAETYKTTNYAGIPFLLYAAFHNYKKKSGEVTEV